MNNLYDERYKKDDFYWGLKPSPLCFEIIKLLPPQKELDLLDLGCGEGRNAIFFAKNGYNVTAFDLSQAGINKAVDLAKKLNLNLTIFKEDICKYSFSKAFDVIFSTGTLQYLQIQDRENMIMNYKKNTRINGLNAFSILVYKPFIPQAPDSEPSATKWLSGEIMQYYSDWKIEFIQEDIFNCNSSGVPHQHAVNRIIARKLQ